MSLRKVPVILGRFQRNVNFLEIFENTEIIEFHKQIRPVEAELFHADGYTDITKVTVAFRNFANAPKHCVVSITLQFKGERKGGNFNRQGLLHLKYK
jgi:hypothetical protein